MFDWKNVGKAFVSLFCIIALLLIYGSAELFDKLGTLTFKDLVVILLFCWTSLAILATRFKCVIAFRRISKPWSSAFSLQLMGLTLNQFLPGIYGGDILRATYYMPSHALEKSFLTAAVIFERVCGLVAMIIIGCVASLYLFFVLGHTRWLIMSVVLVIFSGILFLFSIQLRPSAQRNNATVHRWVRMSQEVIEHLFLLGDDRKLLLSILSLSMASQIFSICTYWYLFTVMQVSLPISAIAAVVALGWLVTLLPISLNGLGVRETGLVVGFVSFGVSKSISLSVALIALIPTLFFAGCGAILIGRNFQRIMDLRRIVKNKNVMSPL